MDWRERLALQRQSSGLVEDRLSFDNGVEDKTIERLLKKGLDRIRP